MLKTPGKQLREKFMNNKMFRENHNDDQYMSKLKQMGVLPHPAVFPAYFQLKNGLQYPGMAASQPISANQTLVTVPEKLILSSMKALQEPNLVDVFCHQFYHDAGVWEDRVLLTYCLYLCSVQAKDNIFYDMVQHMSKDIDIACFWQDEQIDLFRDNIMKAATKIDRQSFEGEWSQFEKVRKQYPILQTPSFDKQNYQWIFTHITSRCFGKSIQHTSFVPYCQFFNHHISSVYYKVEDNKQQLAKKNEEQDNMSDVSSSGSLESDQYVEDGEYAYYELQVPQNVWGGKQCLNLDKKQKKTISDYEAKLLERLELEISWKDFSIFFVGKFMQKVKIAHNEYIKGRKNFETSIATMKNLESILQTYTKLIKSFYQKKYGKKYTYAITNRQNFEETKPDTKFIRPDPQTYKPSYNEFKFVTDKKDHFNANCETYFCYGRNSNRHLLLHYGFAIEGNKYDHVWVSYDISFFFKTMPDVFERSRKLGLSMRRKFKINQMKLNIDLIIYHRLIKWNLYTLKNLNEIFFVTEINHEVEVLNEVRFSLQHKLKVIEGNEDLTDKSLTYHQYFIAVFHIEQARILKKQISLLQKLKEYLKKLQRGAQRQKIQNELFSESEKYMVRTYLNSVYI